VLERFTWGRVVRHCLAVYDGTARGSGVSERAAA
jgi:hypothetical protein